LNTWNIVILILNVALFVLIISKINQFNNIYQENLQVQNNIENLLEQNSRLVDLILDELEGKIKEARHLTASLEAKSNNAFILQEPQPPREAESPARRGLSGQGMPAVKSRQKLQEQSIVQEQEPDIVDDDFPDFNGSARSKIIYMKQLGMSVQEIAEKLQLSQGEIDLKLNLEKKKNLRNKMLRKLK